MNTNPSPRGKSEPDPSGERRDEPVQTGALPGLQPGVGADSGSPRRGQSNVDATLAQGVEYGEHHRAKP